MPELLASTLAFLACYVAFALFALSQPAHLKAVDPLATTQGRPQKIRNKLIAASLLASALLILLQVQGSAFGSLLWMLLLSASAACLALTLSWKPRWLRFLARMHV